MSRRLAALLLLLASVVCTQRRVDPKNAYNRVIAVVGFVGSGTPSDPRRPQYAPWPPSQDPSGIVAFSYIPSDDGKFALTKYNAALNSWQRSSACNDLTDVVSAMSTILSAGSLLTPNYLFWKAIWQGPGVYHVYQPGDIYVGNTAFGSINTH